MRSKEASTNIIFVRHGQTDFPIDRVYCDQTEDPTLNASGREQAEGAARLLEGIEVSAIYASPARRTTETALAIAKVAGAKPVFDPSLVERRFGVWEGLYFHEIEARFPQDYQSWSQDKVGYTPTGGETIPELLARMKASVSEIVRRHNGETVVIVSHVGPIRVCLADALEMPISLYRQLRIDYAALSRVDYGQKHNNIIYINRVGY